MKNIIFKIYNIFIRFKTILIPIAMLLIIPIASSFILGYQFSSHQVQHVPTIIVDHDNSSLSQNLVNQIKRNEIFNVKNYSQNNDDVKNLIDKGSVVVGIIIPENFSKDLIEGSAPKVAVIYDGSQMSAVGAAKGKISEVLGTIKAGYLINIAEGKLGLTPQLAKSSVVPIQYNSRFIGNPTKNTSNFMLEGMLIAITQIGIVVLGIIISDKKNYLLLLLKCILCSFIGAISILSALIVQIKYFAVPYKGSIMAAVILTMLYSTGMTSLGVVIGLIKNDKVSAISSSMGLVSATVLLSGFTFPVLAMPDVFTAISKYAPFLYYGIPMRDLSLIGLDFNDVLIDIHWLMKFILIMWLIIFVLAVIDKLTNYVRKYISKNRSLNIFRRRVKDEFSKSNN